MREDDADVAITLADDEYIDLLLFIEQSIKEEMQIQEGEEYLAREDADLDEESAALEEEWRLREQDNIVCPLCGRQTVDVRYGTVMCKVGGCGFRLCVQDEAWIATQSGSASTRPSRNTVNTAWPRLSLS